VEQELERRLIERAQRGDMAAFETLYRAYAPAVLRQVIRPRVRNPADAEDVLVDTFTVALEQIGRFEWRDTSLFAWLARIAANKAWDVGRRAGRDARARERLTAREAPEPTEARPEEAVLAYVDRVTRRERVATVLADINPRYAEALTLRLLRGLERQECAAALGVRLGTFDVLLLRATRAFRAAWVARYGEEPLP
jgi:RNA polymerase sigma-70 factor (ECF subfamily)